MPTGRPAAGGGGQGHTCPERAEASESGGVLDGCCGPCELLMEDDFPYWPISARRSMSRFHLLVGHDVSGPPAWRRWCWRRGPEPLARRVHHEAPPECGRPLPPAVSDRHGRPKGWPYPVHARPGKDLRARAGPRTGPGRPRPARSRSVSRPTRHAATGRRHSLRQARRRLTRHRDSSSPHHLAPVLIRASAR